MQYLSCRCLKILTIPIILAWLSLGCGLSGGVSSSTPVRRPFPTFTPMPVMMTINTHTPALATIMPTAQIQATPVSPSPTPPPPPTPTPASNEVMLNVTQAMNVRGGPGTNYPVIGAAPAGSVAKVLGRNTDSTWLQVEYPPISGKMGWLSAKLVKLTGKIEAVIVAQAPAPPPPPATKPPEKPTPPPAPAKPKYQFTPTAWSASKNPAMVHFRGFIKDEGGNKVNGFSVLVDNGSWSVLSHPSGASRWYSQPDGGWDVVLPNVATGVGTWTLTLVSYDCPGFFDTSFNGQCKQFTRRSEDIKVTVMWPDETVIWADWVCHWDCNKGLYSQPYRKP